MLYFLAKMKLVRSMLGPQASLRPLSEASPALQEAIRSSGPFLRGYERLASIYHKLAQTFCPDYPAFLRVLGKKHRRPLRAILDLACGIGFLTPRLAVDAEIVVGLDLSDEMLAGARARCAGLANVRLAKADFREFTLDQRFDAIVSSNDSLNYLAEPAELLRVFRCVRRHLNPHGFFVFDALDDKGLRFYSERFSSIQIDNTQCSLVFQYDPVQRVERSLAVFDSGIELHRRIPIEPDEVATAARGAGLSLVDWFSIVGLGLFRSGGIRNFYVLKNEEAASPSI